LLKKILHQYYFEPKELLDISNEINFDDFYKLHKETIE
jgi:hypothetical protein